MRRFLRGLGTAIWRFMVFFSFIVNVILVVVLLVLGLLLFDIKTEIADPLIGGLHSTATGLEESTIDWTIPVRETVPVNLPNIPINQQTIISSVNEINGQPVEPIAGETVVTLTRPVPITIFGANIQSNDLSLRNATVNITLPEGTRLPVALDLAIKLENAELPVNLDVRAVIPLEETQLHDPVTTLGLLFEPLAISLHNLPNNFGEAWDFGGAALGGTAIDELLGLTAPDGSGFAEQPYDAWEGFSQTAGLNYTQFDQLFPPENQPLETGIVVPGGIPALDAYVRPELYTDSTTPMGVSQQAIDMLQTDGLPPRVWNGQMAAYFRQQQGIDPAPAAPVEVDSQAAPETTTTDEQPTQPTPDPAGILPTPEGN